MRLPNGYGSVIKLGGRRRKPYAVRITCGRKLTDHGFIQQYKYLEYFEKQKDAYAYLADYNAGKVVKEHQSFSDMPTFAEVYDRWLSFKKKLKKAPSKNTIRNYDIAFRRYASLHSRKFATIRTSDIQEIADTLKDKSDSTVGMAKSILTQMYEFAIRNEWCEKNYAELVVWEYTNPEENIHTPFQEAEIQLLWDHSDEPYVDFILMMIYTGMRASEFVGIETKNLHLDEGYLIGGMKTEAGTDRVIPIHDAVMPFFRKHYNKKKRYLILNMSGDKMNYTNFLTKYWSPTVKRLGIDHIPHDTRHTFATLSSRYQVDKLCLKLIMGHAVKDITDGVYVTKLPSELLQEVHKIPSRFN